MTFFQLSGNAQRLNIKILSNENKKPLPYAHVCTEGISSGRKSYKAADKNGKIKIQIKEKTLLSVSYVGHKTVIDTVTPGISNKSYSLIKSGFDIDEVVITGNTMPVPADKSIYEVKLIGSSEINNKAANNLAEVLSDKLSIRLQNDPSTGTSMKLQGLSGENVKILIDGVPVIGRLAGNIDLSQIGLNNVHHIEIIEGPMSVIYGSNALAGVINIITKQNLYSAFKTKLNSYYESVGVYNLTGNMAFRKNQNNFNINFGRNFFSGFDPDTSNRSMQFKPKEQYNTGLNYNYNGRKTKITIKTAAFQEKLLDRSNLIKLPYEIKGFNTWFITKRLSNNLKINHSLTKRSRFNILAAYSYYNRQRLKYQKNMTTLDTFLTSGTSDHDTTVFDAFISRGVYNFKNNEIKIQAGFDINLEYGQGKRMKNGNENIHDFAGFAGLLWNILKGVTIQPGVRASYNSKYQAPIVPSLNLKFNKNKFTARASYARGFRAPSLKELYLYFYDSNHQIEGNENLEAEYSHNYNISANYKYIKNKNSFTFQTKAYYNSIENMISLVQADPKNELHYINENIGNFKSLGGEIRFEYNLMSVLKFSSGFTRAGRTDLFDESTFIFNSSFNSNLSLNLIKDKVMLSAFYKYNGQYPFYAYFENKLQVVYMNPYHNLNATIKFNILNKRIIITSGVKNIFNNIQIGTSTSLQTGTHGTSDGVSSLAGWGRAFFVGLKMNITKY